MEGEARPERPPEVTCPTRRPARAQLQRASGGGSAYAAARSLACRAPRERSALLSGREARLRIGDASNAAAPTGNGEESEHDQRADENTALFGTASGSRPRTACRWPGRSAGEASGVRVRLFEAASPALCTVSVGVPSLRVA